MIKFNQDIIKVRVCDREGALPGQGKTDFRDLADSSGKSEQRPSSIYEDTVIMKFIPVRSSGYELEWSRSKKRFYKRR